MTLNNRYKPTLPSVKLKISYCIYKIYIYKCLAHCAVNFLSMPCDINCKSRVDKVTDHDYK